MAILRLGGISVDLTARTTRTADGHEVRLTPLEYRILAVLARHSESIVTQATLLKDVWGPDRDDSGSLRVYIASLRRKLEVNPSRPKHIITELGLGCFSIRKLRLMIQSNNVSARGGVTLRFISVSQENGSCLVLLT
jgi:DNA-binding response OmpR family regulator